MAVAEDLARAGWQVDGRKLGLTDSTERVRTIEALARLFIEASGKYHFFVDQGNNLKAVGNKDAMASWSSATLEMADSKNSLAGYSSPAVDRRKQHPHGSWTIKYRLDSEVQTNSRTPRGCAQGVGDVGILSDLWKLF